MLAFHLPGNCCAISVDWCSAAGETIMLGLEGHTKPQQQQHHGTPTSVGASLLLLCAVLAVSERKVVAAVAMQCWQLVGGDCLVGCDS